jgi:phosphoglucomutase
MALSPRAGKPATKEMLVDLARLEREYYARVPDPDEPAQRVGFGTSGHRGSSLRGSFTEAHVLAITQAICDYRRSQHIDGPLHLGKDTHALSSPAEHTALEVLAANAVETRIQRGDAARARSSDRGRPAARARRRPLRRGAGRVRARGN